MAEAEKIVLKNDPEITIAMGRGCTETQFKNKSVRWSNLLNTLSKPILTKESMAEFDSMTKPQRDAAKNTACFVGGPVKDGIRHKENIPWRQVLTLDFDHTKPNLWEIYSLLNSWASCMYSTHSHRSDKPRFRYVALLSRPVNAD